jgi:HK97 family phage prohead protease
MSTEQRFFNEADYKAELRFEERGEKKQKVIHGYPAKFNKKSLNLGGYRENILPGAFSRSLREKNDVRALVNHDPNMMLGRTAAGTLQLEEDRTGLHQEVEPGDTSVARDVVQWIQRGEMDQGSFRFRVRSDNWRVEDGETIRDLIDCDLRDVSVVTFPAYEDTSALVRSVSAATKLAGIDFGRLASVLVRVEHKLAVTTADREFLRESREALDKTERDLGGDKTGNLVAASRRLQIAERELSD